MLAADLSVTVTHQKQPVSSEGRCQADATLTLEVVVPSLSRVPTCNPMDCSTPGSLPFTMSGSGRGWLRGHCHVDGRQIWCLRGHGEIGIKSFESTRPRDSVDRETPAAAKELIAKLIPPSREKMRTPATKEGIN